MAIRRFLGLALLLLIGGGGVLFWQHPNFEAHRRSLVANATDWVLQSRQWAGQLPMGQEVLNTLGQFTANAMDIGNAGKTAVTDYFFPDMEARKQRAQAKTKVLMLQQKLAEKQAQSAALETEIKALKQDIDAAEQMANPAKKWIAQGAQQITRWIPKDWGQELPFIKDWSWPFSSDRQDAQPKAAHIDQKNPRTE